MARDWFAYMTAAELAQQVRTGEVSPVEIVEDCIARIEERNPSLNALIYLGFDDARAQAKAAEQAVANGAELGPLHGVPAAIKDLFDYKPGWPSTFGGVRAFKDYLADEWCPFGERVEAGGAILMGKTNSPVMGFRGTCDNPLFGPSRNPFDLRKNTGGSSGGSAAAVADGLLPFAEGTDGGGSIRIPAAWCGVYGYKASYGRIPTITRPNAFGATMPFVFEGPLTRTVEDAALVMTAVTGYDPRDPFALDEEVDYLGALRRGVAGMRIAYSPDFGMFPVAPQVADTVAKAVAAFEEAGAHVEEVALDMPADQRELADLWCRQIMSLSVDSFEDLKANGLDVIADHRDDFPDQYLYWLDHTYGMSLLDVLGDQGLRSKVYDVVQGVFADYDLLVTPTLACLPVDNAGDGDTVGPTEVNGEEVNELIGWCLTYPINFTGHPAASIPAGLADGLPVGMQLIGRRYADTDVIAASAAFEQVRPWLDTYDIPRQRPLD